MWNRSKLSLTFACLWIFLLFPLVSVKHIYIFFFSWKRAWFRLFLLLPKSFYFGFFHTNERRFLYIFKARHKSAMKRNKNKNWSPFCRIAHVYVFSLSAGFYNPVSIGNREEGGGQVEAIFIKSLGNTHILRKEKGMSAGDWISRVEVVFSYFYHPL